MGSIARCYADLRSAEEGDKRGSAELELGSGTVRLRARSQRPSPPPATAEFKAGQMPLLKNGTTLGRWKLGRFRGGGGQGEVWEVRAEGVPHTPPRAMKICTSTDEVARKRFEREVALLAELEHPGLPRVLDHDLGWTSEPRSGLECSYFVTELFAGSLRDHAWIHRAPTLALELFREMLDPVIYLHEREPQVLHRDLKPDNILVGGEPWRAILADLGIATPPAESADEKLTQAREVVGTLVYRAPEVAAGHAHSERSDIYSLGRILEWMLSGREPVQLEPWTAFDESLYSSTLRTALSALLRKACAYDPRDRYESVVELRKAFPSVRMDLARVASNGSGSTLAPTEEYARVTDAIRARDVITWRGMEKETQVRIPEALVEWRHGHENDRPSEEAHLRKWMDGLLGQLDTYLVRAVASAEFAGQLPGNPMPFLELLWQIPRWNGNGLSVLVEFPRSVAYVVQYMLGATFVSAGNTRGAAEHAVQRVPQTRERETQEIWRQHDLVGWPDGLGRNATSAWDYLLTLPTRHAWLDRAFGDALGFRKSLVGYSWILCLLDWCSEVRAPSGKPLELDQLRPEGPPLCVLVPDDMIAAGFSVAFRSRHDVDGVCAVVGADPAAVRRGWQDWLRLVYSYAAGFRKGTFWDPRFKPKPDLP